DQINSNIRELEGALIRVIAYSSLTNQSVTLNLTNEVLKDIISSHQAKRMSIDYIQDTVAEYFQIDVSDLKAKKRTKNITVPRHVAMYLCRELTEASLPKIGESFGGRDHTTVLHACDRVREMMKNDAQFSRVVK